MSLLVLHLNAQPVTPRSETLAAEGMRRQLDPVLRGVERRALRMAEFSTGNRDDALEIVQDSMLAFVRHYADKPQPEWTPLFYRVLDSRILDFHRRRNVRSRWLSWLPLGSNTHDETAADPLEQVADEADPGPLQRLADHETGGALDVALKALPLRQRQCFLLRIWEGLDVADTARAMQCSEGSVKTHLSRAMAALRSRLESHHG
jgi:RNA polymerase sigma-70 factor, ECF subfamily